MSKTINIEKSLKVSTKKMRKIRFAAMKSRRDRRISHRYYEKFINVWRKAVLLKRQRLLKLRKCELDESLQSFSR